MGRLSKRTIQCRAARKQRDAPRHPAGAPKAASGGSSCGSGGGGGGRRSPSPAASASVSGSASPAASAPASAQQGDAAAPPAARRLGLLRKLGLSSLQRYSRAHGLLDRGPAAKHAAAASREALLCWVAEHFTRAEVVDESEVLLGFVRALRREASSESSG
ncbi:hypothetical protein Rsub_10505 [Raphidocelis subcapitata]|uniref:Histone deacetylase complex subunit SAP30 Sin3 binding domain-containing protein n=1 Tax=Raphidocelis subcapitata TaxID=307507 RepID=A0A2V0PDN5_9CHLO|nr:hypothetical protein Rsub_10505 [Raphidocelis subcapitata]|eukprot:GBF97629.1 hypothetical protein Rsub_10505 [Raphidocelis subcapitata]